MVRWVVGLILHYRPFELFIVPASTPQLVKQRSWYVVPCLWAVAYKRPIGANRKVSFSEWSFTICMTPCNRIKNVLSALLNKIFPFYLVHGELVS